MYFLVFKAGMRSGDFSALASVYAPDTTLTESSPKGVITLLQQDMYQLVKMSEDLQCTKTTWI